MIIPLNEKYRVKGTENCWQLEKSVMRKGQREWVAFKYFTALGKAVSAACEREIRLDSAGTLNEALQAIDTIAAKYNKLLDDALSEIESREAA